MFQIGRHKRQRVMIFNGDLVQLPVINARSEVPTFLVVQDDELFRSHADEK